MESYLKLYLGFAAEYRRKAEVTGDSQAKKALLKLASAYELAAEAIESCPEAA